MVDLKVILENVTQEGEAVSCLCCHAVYDEDAVLLILTEGFVGMWMEYFEDLLNLTDMPSVKETGCSDEGDNLLNLAHDLG